MDLQEQQLLGTMMREEMKSVLKEVCKANGAASNNVYDPQAN